MRNRELLIALEVNDNGTARLKPVGRVVRGVGRFEEAVPKGGMSRSLLNAPEQRLP